MGWIYLLLAGLLECVWAVGMKYTDGFTKLWPSIFCIVLIVVSLGLLSLAMRTIPTGTAYAVWTGIGATALSIYGILFLGEPASVMRVICIFCIISGVAGLKYFA